jgi:hypothetical protein
MIRALNNGGMTPKIWQRAEHEVISLFAGGEAQRLFFPRSPWKKGRAGDMQIIEWMLQTLHQDADDNTVYDPVAHGRHRRHLEYRTKKFVRENRDHIEAVAKALLERKTLTVDEVRRVMFPEKAVTYFVDSLGRATEIQSLSLAP